MIRECSKELQDIFEKINKDNQDNLYVWSIQSPETIINGLISEYMTYKQLLIEQEYEYEKSSTEYEQSLFLLKNEYMEEGMKSTEAKEHAKTNLTSKQGDLLCMQKDINMLKAGIHSIEYQLRLNFKRYDEQLIQQKAREEP